MTTKVNAKKLAQLTGHKASIFSVVAGPDRRHILSGAGDGWVVQWNLDEPELGRLLARVETQLFSLLYLRDQDKVLAGNMNGGVHWIDLKNPEKTSNITHHQKGVYDIQRIGAHAYTLGGDGVLTRWSIPEQRSLESHHLTNKSLRSLDYHAGREEIAVGASDHAIYLLDAATLEIRQTIRPAHNNSVFTVRYSPDGAYLFSGSRDAHLRVWDLTAGGASASSQPAHQFTINDMAIDPSGRWLATGSRDKTIKIWDVESWRLLKVLAPVRDGGHINSVNSLYWSAHRNILVSGSDDRSLILWDLSFE